MNEDENVCAALQSEEYQVLQAVYPDFISNDSVFTTEKVIHFQISVEMSAETVVQIIPPLTDGPRPPGASITLQYLPSIQIDVFLPDDYPLRRPPDILRLQADSSWFSEEDSLKSALLDIWQSGETVLYSWVEFVRSGQFIRDLVLFPDSDPEKIDSETIRLLHDIPGILAQRLVEHDGEIKRDNFRNGSYTCDVCLTSQKGTQCIRLSCMHVFCKGCLEEFWTIAVREGALGKITCVDPDCMKLKKVATEDEIQNVLSTAAFSRWKWLKEKREFEKDIDHSYCPACESPVRPPDDLASQENAWARFRQCKNCLFSFCKACKSVWHGPLFDCPVPVQVLTRYIAASASNEDTVWRQNLERRYTTWVLHRQVTRFHEEAERLRVVRVARVNSAVKLVKLSEDWLAKSTQCCPHCGAYIQRTEGCNFMVCSLCAAQFCYGCGKPYTMADAGTNTHLRCSL